MNEPQGERRFSQRAQEWMHESRHDYLKLGVIAIASTATFFAVAKGCDTPPACAPGMVHIANGEETFDEIIEATIPPSQAENAAAYIEFAQQVNNGIATGYDLPRGTTVHTLVCNFPTVE